MRNKCVWGQIRVAVQVRRKNEYGNEEIPGLFSESRSESRVVPAQAELHRRMTWAWPHEAEVVEGSVRPLDLRPSSWLQT